MGLKVIIFMNPAVICIMTLTVPFRLLEVEFAT